VQAYLLGDKYMNVFDLYAKLSLDTSQYTEGLNNAKKSTSTLGSAIKSGFGTAVKVAGAALTAATTAVTAFGAASVKNFAAYEQLVGGVDKLYGEASEKLQAYADAAYKTAGMSANQYMETATSFSAALINSLGGDVDKAADMTDMAMRAMSDNVNVFGSDMSAVQSAFAGFAKQNYTMLDNLKLGYGGTKSEMERLIADANDYRKSIGESADLSIESFADIVQAIQSVQEAQNIAGTTNKEAMSTIEGSANAVKAAWQNVITAIGRGEGLKEAFSNFTSALFGESEGEGLLNQIIPRIETTMEGIGGFIEEAAPLIADKLPALVSAVLPSAINAGLELLKAIGKGMIDSIDVIVSAAWDIAETLMNSLVEATSGQGNKVYEIIDWLIGAFVENSMGIIDAGFQIIENLALGMANALPDFIPDMVDRIFTIFERLLQPGNISKLVNAGVSLIKGLLQGLINGVQMLVAWLPNIIKSILDAVKTAVPQIIQGAVDLIGMLVESLPEIITGLLNAIPDIIQMVIDTIITLLPVFIDGIIQLVTMIADNLPEILTAIIDSLPMIIQSIIDGLMELVPALVQGAIQLTIGVLTHLPEIIAAIIQAIPQIIEAIIMGFMPLSDRVVGLFSDIGTAVSNWWSNLKQSIADGWNTFIENVKTWFEQLPYNLGYALADMIIKLGEWYTQAKEWVSTNVSKLIESIVNWFAGLPNKIWNWLLETIKKIGNWITDTDAKVKAEIPRIIDNIVNFFAELPAKAWNWGVDMISNFVDGIASMAQQAWDAVEGFAQGIADRLGFSEPELGPLSNFHTYAPDMMELFAQGIKDNADIVNDAIADNFDFSDAIVSPEVDYQQVYQSNTEGALNQMISLLQQLVDNGMDVTLEGDAREIFNVVEKQNRQRTKATGYNSLAMAGG
jgi:phage-related protein